MVDDSVDKASNEEEARLNIAKISSGLETASAEKSEPDVTNFVDLSKKYEISAKCALDLVAGVAGDIGQVRLESQNDLLRYCYQVAATVGMMICAILNVRSKEAQAFAIDLGIGMQLTNIARDVVEDYQCNRIYLPASLIDAETVEKAINLGDNEAREEVYSAVLTILEWAARYYRSSDKGISFLPLSSRLGILTASRAYEKIGKVIKSDPAVYFSRRAYTTTRQKQEALLSAATALCFKPSYWYADRVHDRDLHSSLTGIASFEALSYTPQ